MNNREILAKNISERFINAISGNDKAQILEYNPEDRIHVGKLSPQSKEDSFSSSVLIKQISVVFRIPKKDVDVAKLNIYPQGNFFFRVVPTLAQQKEYFLKDFNSVFKSNYQNFEEFVAAYDSGALTQEMMKHKIQLLPVYEKIAVDRNQVCFSVNVGEIYNKQFSCGSIPPQNNFYEQIRTDVNNLTAELQREHNVIPCQFRDILM